MGEAVKTALKAPEIKKENQVSQVQKGNFYQPVSSPVEQILFLQRTIGNQAVQKLMKSGALQAKLRIGEPGDVYEQEADRVAEQVMRMPELQALSSDIPSIQRVCPKCEEEELKRQPIKEEDEEEKLQRKPVEEEEEELQAKATSGSISEVNPDIESHIQSFKGGGQSLSENERAFFEPRFGHDFSQVRVHSGGDAAQSARDVNANAYTVGHNIVFGAGQFVLGTHEGRRLIAHELTHVVQQGSAKSSIPAQLSIRKTSGHQVMRSLALESTASICHRVLISRNIKISQGGLRVVLLLNPLDTGIPNCQNHKFWVTLTKPVEWWFDKEIATCEAETGRTRSFSFGNLPSGTYYLTIHRVFDHPYCCIEGDILVFDETISADSSSCVRNKDLSAMDIVHGALDIAGFIPVLGAIPDGINAAIYVVEGDWANAGLSAVAMVPAWGDGVKLGVMGGKSAIKISEKAAFKLGEEGIAKGLKEVKAASKATHTAEEAAKFEKEAAKLEKGATEKLEREAAEKAEKEAAEKAEKEAAEKAEKEAAEKELKKKIAECEGIYATYKALNCNSCKASDTPADRAAKIVCLTTLLAGRKLYLKEKCDYVLAGSIARGSADAERGHMIQVDQIAKMLLKCSTLPTS